MRSLFVFYERKTTSVLFFSHNLAKALQSYSVMTTAYDQLAIHWLNRGYIQRIRLMNDSSNEYTAAFRVEYNCREKKEITISKPLSLCTYLIITLFN